MSTSNTEIIRILSEKKILGEWAQQYQVHSIPTTESGAIDLTKAERIAEGGTHVLYRFQDAHNQDLFERVHKALFHKDEFGIDFEFNNYAIIDKRIGVILQRLDSDFQLKEVMMEFFDHYRDFYQKTNIILDAMGFENILFFKDEKGDW